MLTIVRGDHKWDMLADDGTLPDGAIWIWCEKESRIIYVGMIDKIGVGTVKFSEAEVCEFVGEDSKTHTKNFKVFCLK